jgi:hypothetical protein
MLVSLKRLVLILGLILGTHARAGAQSTEYRIAFVQSPPSSMMVFPPRHAVPLDSSVLLIQQQGNFHDGYGFRITGNYRDQNPGSISPFQETKTSFVTESRLPVAQIWGARMRVSLFKLTLKTGNIMLGPLASNEALHRPRHTGEPRSADLYGIGVSVPLGRNARWEGSTVPWRSLLRIGMGDDWPRLRGIGERR